MSNELKYGDKVFIQNGYTTVSGGYLDVSSESSSLGYGAIHRVATAPTATRAPGSGAWEIVPAGTNSGQIKSGDLIHLRNSSDNGYLDTNTSADPARQQSTGAVYNVSTNKDSDRAGQGTATWRVFAMTSAPLDQFVRVNDPILLWNVYANGSFLEINAGKAAPPGGTYDVVTNAYWNRGDNVSIWRLAKV
ncbi:hypothetical protein DMH18_26795 [Streptomyces sp. WAC 06783]|uniref:hypothetical protein n=1 Tax=Streptomyces sp. WAC 06783 TaxID=2203211 RepID=UPI000F735889|nr:hypothetical protein [Streptomyces sp. WAC 06783]RSO07041.1 hypothetical protein DMH18_26795 [Streptomyces sp. WAC 06783]